MADTVTLVWFVPPSALASTRQAVLAAGGSRIGASSRSSFAMLGERTFLGAEGAAPAVGEAGVDARVTQYRVETVVPVARLPAVVAALRLAHPHEEPAYDVYPRLDA